MVLAFVAGGVSRVKPGAVAQKSSPVLLKQNPFPKRMPCIVPNVENAPIQAISFADPVERLSAPGKRQAIG